MPLRQPPAAAASKAAAPAPAAADKAPAEVETTVRVDTARLDEIMNMVGELVLVRNRLVRLGSNSGDEAMAKAVSNLDVVTADLQSAVMKTRMQPIKKVFGRFPRLVRDLARSLKKEINLELVGEEPTSTRTWSRPWPIRWCTWCATPSTTVSRCRRSAEAAGKPRTGRVVLSAEQEGDHILLVISDDGKGMDANILRAKAVERACWRGCRRPPERSGVLQPDLRAGLTKTEISDVSGRGVGMDVVKTKIFSSTARSTCSPPRARARRW